MGAKTPGLAQIVTLSGAYALFMVAVLVLHAQYAVPDAQTIAKNTVAAVDQSVKNVFSGNDIASLRAVTANAVEVAVDRGVDAIPLKQFEDAVAALSQTVGDSVSIKEQRDVIVRILQSTIFDTTASMARDVDTNDVQQVLVDAVDATLENPATPA